MGEEEGGGEKEWGVGRRRWCRELIVGYSLLKKKTHF